MSFVIGNGDDVRTAGMRESEGRSPACAREAHHLTSVTMINEEDDCN